MPGSELDTDFYKEAAKAELSAALLIGLSNSEMTSLQNAVDSVSLGNYAANEYTKGFKAEANQVASNQSLIETSLNANRIGIQKAEEEARSLKEIYVMMCSNREVTPQNSEAFEFLQESISEQQRTYPQRLLEFTQHKRSFDMVHRDSKRQELDSNLNEANAELAEALESLDYVKKSEDEINAQLYQLERQGQLDVKAKEKELAEADKRLAERKEFLNGNIEAQLLDEIEKLKHHPDMKICDDDSSVASSMNETAPTMHVFEKVSTDLESLFKNPNDFPPRPSAMKKRLPPQSISVVAKKARVEPEQASAQKNRRTTRRLKFPPGKISKSVSFASTSPIVIQQKIVVPVQAQKASSKDKPQKIASSTSLPLANVSSATNDKRQSAANLVRTLAPKDIQKKPSAQLKLSNITTKKQQQPEKLPKFSNAVQPTTVVSDEVVESSEPDVVPYKPRVLNDEYLENGKKTDLNTVTAQKAQEATVEDGHERNIDDVSLPETPEDCENSKENSVEKEVLEEHEDPGGNDVDHLFMANDTNEFDPNLSRSSSFSDNCYMAGDDAVCNISGSGDESAWRDAFDPGTTSKADASGFAFLEEGKDQNAAGNGSLLF